MELCPDIAALRPVHNHYLHAPGSDDRPVCRLPGYIALRLAGVEAEAFPPVLSVVAGTGPSLAVACAAL